MKKKNSNTERKPYHYHPHIFVYDHLDFMNDVIKPGDILKFKNTRGTFRFLNFVHNSRKDVSWIECIDVKDGYYRFFYVEKLKTVVRPKKSRRKKQLVK